VCRARRRRIGKGGGTRLAEKMLLTEMRVVPSTHDLSFETLQVAVRELCLQKIVEMGEVQVAIVR
jgi:hypothetical protein